MVNHGIRCWELAPPSREKRQAEGMLAGVGVGVGAGEGQAGAASGWGSRIEGAASLVVVLVLLV